jgi:hypothetical protein
MVYLERGFAVFVGEVAIFTEAPGPCPHLFG